MKFESPRVALVDRVGENLVVRGPLPLAGDDSHFALQEISEVLKIDLSSYFFLTISFIDNTSERFAFEREFKNYGADPGIYPESYWPPYKNKGWDSTKMLGSGIKRSEGGIHPGALNWWPIEGFITGMNPAVYLNSPGWDFSGVIDRVIGMSQQDGPMTLVYFHCFLGADRTGAAHMGYLMKARSMTYKDALATATDATSAGAPSQNYQNLAYAYSKMLSSATTKKLGR